MLDKANIMITSFFKGFSLSKLFFYIIVFLFPFQTRKIFFTSHSFYYNYHIFHNTFYFYLTDLLFLSLILAWIWENRKSGFFFNSLSTKISHDIVYWFLLIFWLILGISLIFSRETYLGFYGFLRMTQFFLILAYIRENFNMQFGFSREKSLIFWLILASAWFQAGLGIYQYLDQSSAGLKVFGEEFLRPGIIGVAEFASSGLINPLLYDFLPYLRPISDITLNIRAYGTFPHPNVLAGFLFMAVFFNLYLLYFSREKLILSLSLVLVSTGLVVSFSRLAWLVTLLGLGAWLIFIFLKIRPFQIFQMKTGRLNASNLSYRPARLALIALILLISLLFNLVIFGSQIRDRLISISGKQKLISQESFIERNTLNQIAWEMVKKNPILGVGWKNFVVEIDQYSKERILPYLHQPVHNIYLLIAAEGGVLALFAFLFSLYYIVRHAIQAKGYLIFRSTSLIILFGFLVIGIFDHYLLTIQQGSLMFWITLGLLAVKGKI